MSRYKTWLVCTALAVALTAPARAGVSEARITKRQIDHLSALVVMEQNRLVESTRAGGLRATSRCDGSRSTAARSNGRLLSSGVDLSHQRCINLLLLGADQGRGQGALRASAACPCCWSRAIPTSRRSRDFTDKDKIAVPTIKVSSQAMVLKMAMEKMYGEASRDKLDPMTIQLGHPDAMIAVVNGSSEVNSHFSAPPYQYTELKAPGVHLVLDSSEVFGGPASNAVVFGTRKFYDANPKTIAAFLAALTEANQLIARDPAAAAKIYLDATKEKYTVDEVVAMIKSPNVVYSTTPNATMVFANFMAKTGLIKTRPASWKEFFFPVVHSLPGT